MMHNSGPYPGVFDDSMITDYVYAGWYGNGLSWLTGEIWSIGYSAVCANSVTDGVGADEPSAILLDW